jgi:hypothetical protein
LNTSWDKGAELLGKTINVLFGKKTVSRLNMLLCRHDFAVTTKLLVKISERPKALFHSNDD